MKQSISDFFENETESKTTKKFVFDSLDTLMEIPIKPALWQYQRMIENVAKQLEKKISFAVKGDELTLPRDTWYNIQDALVHLVRNTIDHGIESAEERQKTNKAIYGQLTIDCAQRDQNKIIKLYDDGRGIDRDILVKVALKKGLIKDQDVKKLTEQEKLELIFIPGFSTKENVSELSGRGVGMEVVKKNIESIGGKIVVHSEVGHGTAFEIVLPS